MLFNNSKRKVLSFDKHFSFFYKAAVKLEVLNGVNVKPGLFNLDG